MRTPALIFDFGNVVAHFDYRKAADVLGREHGLAGAGWLERVRGLGFDDLLKRYERGELTSKEFSATVCELAALTLSHDEFAAAWADIFWLNEPVSRLVAFLKGRGYTLVLGSNTNDLHAAHFRRQFADTFAHFDRLVLSYEVGQIKPSAEFYLACARAAGARPEDCVFIDDLPENVAGAQAAGLVGIVYRDDQSLLDDLRGLGVEVPERTVIRE